MRVLAALWMKEWLALSRDPHGLAVLFLMPAAFIVIMSLALSDVFRDGGARQVEFAVVGPEAARLADDIAGDGFKVVPSPGSEDAARQQVRKGKPALVLVVPEGFGIDPTKKLKLLADPTLPPVQLVGFLQRVQGAALGIKSSSPPLDLEVVGNPRGGKPSSVQQNVPAWLIFGMFCVVMPLSALFIVERRDGTLARLASLRVPFALLLAGKVGPYFIINVLQAGLMLAAGRYLVPWIGGESLVLPTRWDLLAVVIACTSLAAIGWGLLVAVASRTSEQATVLGGVGNILAAALGGIMVPRFVMPASMQPWADLSPMAWSLDGFHAVILRQGSAADIALPCVKLVVLAAALLAAAFWLHRRRG